MRENLALLFVGLFVVEAVLTAVGAVSPVAGVVGMAIGAIGAAVLTIPERY